MSHTDLALANVSGVPSTWRAPDAATVYQESTDRLYSSLRGPVRAGYAIAAIFVFGFGTWAAYAPLAGGANAYGIVSPESSRRTIQHLEGGIVRELRVKEGDTVTAGQALVILEATQSTASHESLLARKFAALARQARLQAERAGADDVVFPPELIDGGVLHPAAQSQLQIFKSRQASHATRMDLLGQRTEQLRQQISGLQAQGENMKAQLALIKEEVEGKETLLRQGLLPKPEALRLRRSETELRGRVTDIDSEIGKARQLIEEAKLQIMSAGEARLDEITLDADKAQSELSELNERLRGSQDILNRTTISAPVAGTVINMRLKTIGGVVQSGEPLMEIVPSDDALIIEAHVSPNDIHRVHVGQTAQIHLSAYSSRIMPRLDGLVRSTSPDRVRDASGQQAYYLARVEVDRRQLKERAANVQLIPGMGAEVVFVAEKRTMLEYLLKPFRDALRLGMREQ